MRVPSNSPPLPRSFGQASQGPPPKWAGPAPEMSVERGRLDLHARPDCCFVDAPTFRKLIVSNRALGREDQPQAFARGLRDSVTGTLFVIEEELLFAARAMSRA